MELFHSPEEAVAGAQAVYTDVWASMGQEERSCGPREDLRAVSGERRADEAGGAGRRLSCTACRRIAALEVTDAVMDSPRSMVFDQAENRLHVQKAILLMLLS